MGKKAVFLGFWGCFSSFWAVFPSSDALRVWFCFRFLLFENLLESAKIAFFGLFLRVFPCFSLFCDVSRGTFRFLEGCICFCFTWNILPCNASFVIVSRETFRFFLRKKVCLKYKENLGETSKSAKIRLFEQFSGNFGLFYGVLSLKRSFWKAYF